MIDPERSGASGTASAACASDRDAMCWFCRCWQHIVIDRDGGRAKWKSNRICKTYIYVIIDDSLRVSLGSSPARRRRRRRRESRGSVSLCSAFFRLESEQICRSASAKVSSFLFPPDVRRFCALRTLPEPLFLPDDCFAFICSSLLAFSAPLVALRSFSILTPIFYAVVALRRNFVSFASSTFPFRLSPVGRSHTRRALFALAVARRPSAQNQQTNLS